MSAKTKIVVLHMKELIYTGIFIALGILFIVLFIMMFSSDKEKTPQIENPSQQTPEQTSLPTSGDAIYIPGIYTTELVLGGESIDVEVIVNKDSITSISMKNLNEAITTMYPLLQPTFDSICTKVYESQSLEGITYNDENKYTSLVLLQAIANSLSKATIENQSFEPLE